MVRLEAETGMVLANSPTQNVGYTVLSNLQKIRHESPILSLDKTKDPLKLQSFLGDKKGILSWKLDGLTIVLKYSGGELVQAITRGNGEIGEDVTHNARVFANLPFNQSVNLKLSLAKVRLLKFLLFDKFLPNSSKGVISILYNPYM